MINQLFINMATIPELNKSLINKSKQKLKEIPFSKITVKLKAISGFRKQQQYSQGFASVCGSKKYYKKVVFIYGNGIRTRIENINLSLMQNGNE